MGPIRQFWAVPHFRHIVGVLLEAMCERLPPKDRFPPKTRPLEQDRSSGGDEMRHPQETVATNDWDGEFGSYDEWARLGPQPPYRSATFVDAQGRRCVTQQDFARARDNRAFPVRYRWDTMDPANPR